MVTATGTTLTLRMRTSSKMGWTMWARPAPATA